MERHWRAWTSGFMLLVAVVYIAGITEQWTISRDSALYLNLARNLAAGQGYQLDGVPHTFVPPGMPLLLAGMMKLGMGIPAMNVAMFAMGLATLGLVYLLFLSLASRPWALLLTLTVALSNEMTQRSNELLSDVPAMLMATAAMLIYWRGLQSRRWRRFYEVASLLLVGGCVLRIAYVPLAVGLAVGLVASAWRTPARARAVVNAVIVCVVVGGLYLAFDSYVKANLDPTAAGYSSTGEKLASKGAVFTLLVDPATSFWEGTGQIMRLLTCQTPPRILCIVLAIVPIVAGMAVRARRRGEWMFVIAPVVYIGVMCLVSDKPRTRYLLPILPLLVLYALEGYGLAFSLIFSRLIKGLKPFDGVSPASVCVLLMILTLIGNNVPLVGRTLVDKFSPTYEWSQQMGIWEDGYMAAQHLRGSTRGAVLAEQPIGYMAGIPCPTISKKLLASSPDAQAIERLAKRLNLAYYVYDDRNTDPTDRDNYQPFAVSMGQYFGDAKPVYVHGHIKVYELKDKHE